MVRAFFLASACLLVACGGDDPSGTTPGDGGAGGGSAASGSGGGHVAGPADMSITLTPYTLAPGDELINCEYFPPDGKAHWISSFDVLVGEGSHHVIPFRVKDQDTGHYGPTPCAQVDVPAGFDGMLPGTQQLHTEFDLPEGVAFRLDADEGLYFQSHFINTTQETITSSVLWNAYTIAEADVQQEAAAMFYSNFALDIPVGESTASDACAAPNDMHIVATSGHMHAHGTKFVGKVNDDVVFDTASWDEPDGRLFPAPGYAVKKDDTISWTCTYGNDTGAPLHFGNSALTDEMCIFAALFYPAPSNPTSAYLCTPPATP